MKQNYPVSTKATPC